MSRTSTITELIRVGKTKNLTYYKTSLIEKVEHIECATKNILLDYIDELLSVAVTVTLSDNEYHKYTFRPKLLAYDIYGDTDLYFLIMIINNINNEKDFDMRTLKIIPPTSMEIVDSIYNTENKFLYRFNDKTEQEAIFENEILRPSTPFEIKQTEIINSDLTELKYELDAIKRIILDMLQDLIRDDLDQIMLDLIIDEINKIRDSINTMITVQIQELLNDHNIINRITHMEREITNIKTILDDILSMDLDGRIIVLEEKARLLKDRMDLLENSVGGLINDSIRNELDILIQEFNNFKDQIIQLIENAPGTDLDGIILEISQLKESLSKLSGISTRDIVFMVQTPIVAGIQSDTEFFVPYKGTIEQIIMSVGVESKLKSNLIIKLQKYNLSRKIWEQVSSHEMDATDVYKIEDVSMPVETEYIRLILDAGDYNNIVNGINFIIRVSEDKDTQI